MAKDDEILWYDRAAMVLELTGLTDELTGQRIASASVQAQLVTIGGGPVEGFEERLTLAAVQGSDGTYRAATPAIALERNAPYVAKVWVVVGEGDAAIHDYRELPVRARVRGAR